MAESLSARAADGWDDVTDRFRITGRRSECSFWPFCRRSVSKSRVRRNMKQSIKLGLLATALMAISGTASAQLPTDVCVVDPAESPYVLDPRGCIVKDPFGLCWRTGSWSVERAAKTAIKGAKYPNWT